MNEVCVSDHRPVANNSLGPDRWQIEPSPHSQLVGWKGVRKKLCEKNSSLNEHIWSRFIHRGYCDDVLEKVPLFVGKDLLIERVQGIFLESFLSIPASFKCALYKLDTWYPGYQTIKPLFIKSLVERTTKCWPKAQTAKWLDNIPYRRQSL